jgi:hypothetical protein
VGAVQITVQNCELSEGALCAGSSPLEHVPRRLHCRRWATNHSPYAPFITGYFLRLVVSALILPLTAAFPAGATSLSEHAGPFGMLAAASLVQSFASTLTFTALGSFFNRWAGGVWGFWG